MPRVGLTEASIIQSAALLLDDDPDAGLNLATLAQRLGVRPPSLYKHVSGVDGLRRGILLAAKRDLADVLTRAAAGTARADAVRAIGTKYRAWAADHPGQYALTVRAPRPGDTEDETASAALADLMFRVVQGFGIGDEDLVDAVRFVRSSLHGFVDLETRGAFGLPVEVSRSFERLLTSVTSALENW